MTKEAVGEPTASCILSGRGLQATTGFEVSRSTSR